MPGQPSGDRTLFINQAATSAILVVVLQPPQDVFNPDRFLNALAGGVIALAIHYLFPINPERMVERAARPIFEELASILEETAAGLEKTDLIRSKEVLNRSRELDERVRGFSEALSAGHETARLSPTRRRSLKHLQLYAGASQRLELSAINTRVLARGAYNASRRGDEIPTGPATCRTPTLTVSEVPLILSGRSRRTGRSPKLRPGCLPAGYRGTKHAA